MMSAKARKEAAERNRKRMSVPVVIRVKDKKTNRSYQKRFPSFTEAGKQLGVAQSTISNWVRTGKNGARVAAR